MTVGVADGQVDEAFGNGVEQVHALPGAHPQAVEPIDVESAHRVVRYARAIVRIVRERGEGVPIVAVQSILGGEPEEAMSVLHDVADQPLRKAVIDGDRLEREDDRIVLCVQCGKAVEEKACDQCERDR